MAETPRPLLITADPLLLDDVIRLATAAGIDMTVHHDSTASAWATAPMVLVGDDVLASAAQRALPRRDSVIVVRRQGGLGDDSTQPDRGGLAVPPGPTDATPAETWRGAVAIGAEHVAVLPEANRWVVDRLSQVHDDATRGGPVISCVPAVGGAGASTLSALLAREARGLLVDIDPFGAAIPVDGGVRWPDLADTRGRIPPASLRNALPSVHGVHVLTGTPDERFTIHHDALGSVLEAGSRGFACTVVDTPRNDGDASRIAWSRSDVAVVVLGPHPSSAARAPALIDAVREVCVHVWVAARTAPRDLGSWALAAAQQWQVPLLPTLRYDRGLAQGEHPFFSPRATARRNARRILDELAPGIRA